MPWKGGSERIHRCAPISHIIFSSLQVGTFSSISLVTFLSSNLHATSRPSPVHFFLLGLWPLQLLGLIEIWRLLKYMAYIIESVWWGTPHSDWLLCLPKCIISTRIRAELCDGRKIDFSIDCFLFFRLSFVNRRKYILNYGHFWQFGIFRLVPIWLLILRKITFCRNLGFHGPLPPHQFGSVAQYF